MSAEAFAIALHHSRAKGATLLVLIGIANHDGDGGAWPSVRTLTKYARVSESQVQRALTQLESLGEIKRYIQQGGDQRLEDWRRPNRYEFRLSCPVDCDRTKHHRTRRDSAVELPLEAPADVEYALARGPVESYPQRAASVRPGRISATGGGRTHATQTNPRETNNYSSKNQPQTARAKDVGGCGHRLIPDTDRRHCVVGCATEKVRSA